MVKVLHSKPPSKSRPPATDRGWKAVGWFGVLLAVIGLTDVALYWYPFDFGVPEWEFGTVMTAYSALPLATIGLAAVVGAVLVRGSRAAMVGVAVVLLSLATLIAIAFWMFVMNLPMALAAAAEGPQAVAIHRGIVRTFVKGLGFGSAYLVAAVVLLRKLPSKRT